jgi:hypothetical protein
VIARYDGESLPPYDPDTPPGAEAKLETYRDALDAAREALRLARDAELEAEQDRDAAKRRAQFDPKCPKVGVFEGVRTTVAYQQAWIEGEIAEEERTYRLAKAARQAASDHLRTLGKQGSFQQSLTKSVSDDYRRNTTRWGA